MNLVRALCGHWVIAYGAPGSEARNRVESEPCNACRVVWADDATPFTGKQAADLLRENERLRKIIRDFGEPEP